MMRGRHLVLLLLFGGCGTAPPAPPPPASAPAPQAPVIPPELQGHVRDAEAIGRALYQHDQVAAIGTDVLVENLGSLQGKNIGGYLAIREGSEQNGPSDVWQVQFFTRDEEPRLAYRVRIFRDRKPSFEALDPPQAVNAGGVALMRARRTALAHLLKTDPPRQPINPVILPGAVLGEKGILVYLLAGTKRPGVAVMGKHHRVLVSEDGTQVLRFEPMTKSILEIPFGNHEPGKTPAGLVVSHIVTEWPLETHVFASLLHKQTVYVATGQHRWKVDGAKISLLPPR